MSTSGQMSARERIAALLDDNSFVEIGALVSARNTDFNMSEAETPADGVVTGYGIINGNLVYVYSQDAEVMNGAVGEMHARKIVKIYEMALKVGAPVIGLLDCAGLRLQEGTDALNAFGELYLKQTMASGVIPQITAVLGTCGGGVALIPALTDFTLMTKENSMMFVNAPNTLDGNRVDKCNTAAAAFQNEVVGDVDYLGEDDKDVLSKIRDLISMIPANNEDDVVYEELKDELNRENPALAETKDVDFILSDISDKKKVLELKADYGKDIVTAFIKLNGSTVGAVANREECLTTAGAQKAAEFVEFCDAFSIPVLTLVNVKGFKAEIEEEKTIAKASAKLTYAFANATVPKVSVIIGKGFGSAYIAMNSKHIGADMVFAYKDAMIGMMCPKSAAKIIYAKELETAENKAELFDAKAAEYSELQTSPVSAARRGYVDDIIEAAATRKRVIAAFEMLFTKREDRLPKKHGTI